MFSGSLWLKCGPEPLSAIHVAGKGLEHGEHVSGQEEAEEEEEDEHEEEADEEEEATAADARAEESSVCIVTGDYAMQNVALQMGLRLVAPDGKRIWQTRRWALRCTACFQICKVRTCTVASRMRWAVLCLSTHAPRQCALACSYMDIRQFVPVSASQKHSCCL